MSNEEHNDPSLRGRFPWLTELLAYTAEMPPRELLRRRRARWKEAIPQTEPAYQGEFGPRVRRIDPRTGDMEVDFRFYLPEAFASRVQIRGTFTRLRWEEMESLPGGMWRFLASEVRAGEHYEFRYLDRTGHWQPATDPLGYRYAKQFEPALNQFNHFALVPDLSYASQEAPPVIDHGLCVFECTLPGLLARWDHGRFFPREHGNYSLAERLLASGLVTQLRRNGYNAVMFPIQASVADLIHFDWKLSYLVSGFGAIDSQIGDWSSLKELVDAFHREDILVIPDIIVVHGTRMASLRSIDRIEDAKGNKLWEDSNPTLHRDYGTWMVNLADRVVRLHLVEGVVRFVRELGLGAFRFDYVDGLIRQYQDRKEHEKNFGELLLRDLREGLRAHQLRPLCLSEAFSERRNDAVRELADVLYQPWVGFVLMDELLRPEPSDFPGSVRAIADAIDRASRIDWPTPTLAYAMSHDEARHDEEVLKGRFPWSVGKHLPQLVLDHAQRLCEQGELNRQDLLDFVADRTAVIETVTWFSADFAYMTLNDFSDSLKLGSYDDPTGWPAVWEQYPASDVQHWVELTGLPPRTVCQRIDRHAERMRRLRRLFVESTSIDPATRSSCMEVSCIECRPEQGGLAILRRNRADPKLTLLALVNLGLHPIRAFAVRLSNDLKGTWVPCDSFPSFEGSPDVETPSLAADGTQPRFVLDLPGNSIIIMARC